MDPNSQLLVEIDTLKDTLAYYIECQLATVEYLAGIKSKSTGDYRRQITIADKMLRDAFILRVELNSVRVRNIRANFGGNVWTWSKSMEPI